MKNNLKILGIAALACFAFHSTTFAKDKKAKPLTKKAEQTATSNESAISLETIYMNGKNGSPVKNIVEVAIGSEAHRTLVAAVKATELVDTLTGPGPYTLFAPSEEAFAKLPKGTVEKLLKPENLGQLKTILEHHAAAPQYDPNLLVMTGDIDMVSGPKLKIEKKGSKLFVQNVEIKKAIQASNGMIYLIDTVLLP